MCGDRQTEDITLACRDVEHLDRAGIPFVPGEEFSLGAFKDPINAGLKDSYTLVSWGRYLNLITFVGAHIAGKCRRLCQPTPSRDTQW